MAGIKVKHGHRTRASRPPDVLEKCGKALYEAWVNNALRLSGKHATYEFFEDWESLEKEQRNHYRLMASTVITAYKAEEVAAESKPVNPA